VKKEFDSKSIYVTVDLQKVIMLSRFDIFKKVLFTKTIVAYNENFVPIRGNKHFFPFA